MLRSCPGDDEVLREVCEKWISFQLTSGAVAGSRSVGPTKLQVTTVMRLLVLLSGGENRFTRLVETASLLGTSLGQFASAGLREKKSKYVFEDYYKAMVNV
ncbi:hypothetical protein CHARACLAT_031453 [Characodon lateralis]|uniref:Uncharacterized protein n=1 Tax=Characodon lateralis TaxID=208331 RepID=A0ABU7D282_9TELE|nr:hypothetical protein [Characodon lateralis]